MPNQPADADIIQEAYAERLKTLFDNYADIAPSDPDGARAKFVAGVAFLRGLRDSAMQAVTQAAAPATAAPRSLTAATKSAAKKKP